MAVWHKVVDRKALQSVDQAESEEQGARAGAVEQRDSPIHTS